MNSNAGRMYAGVRFVEEPCKARKVSDLRRFVPARLALRRPTNQANHYPRCHLLQARACSWKSMRDVKFLHSIRTQPEERKLGGNQAPHFLQAVKGAL